MPVFKVKPKLQKHTGNPAILGAVTTVTSFRLRVGRGQAVSSQAVLSGLVTWIDQSIHSLMQRPDHWTGKNRCGQRDIWVDGKIMKEQNKKVFQNHRGCQLYLRSECKWCHIYVCSPCQVITQSFKFVNWLNS